MRKLSLVLAAAAFFGFASSANAAEVVYGKKAGTILAEGEVLFASDTPNTHPYEHLYTVLYNGRIYACNVNFTVSRHIVGCFTDKY